MSTPAPKKEKTDKQKLAEGAAALRKAKQEAKPAKGAKPASKGKTPPKKKEPVTAIVDAVLPPIGEPEHSIETILKKYVKIAGDNGSLEVAENITTGDYLAAFDHINGLREKSQFLLGDLINQGEGLVSFGGKYAQAMASTGRPLSTLKGYAHVARQIPPDLRLGLEFSICKVVAGVPKLEDKRQLLNAASESKANGQAPTVKEIEEKAKKFKKKPKTKTKAPKADKNTAKPDLEMSGAERELYDELEDAAAKLERQIEGASFVLEMSPTQTASLREKLERVARFYTQIS